MSRDRDNGGGEDDLYSLISSTTDLFTSLDVTESVTDLTISDSTQKTETFTESTNNKTELSITSTDILDTKIDITTDIKADTETNTRMDTKVDTRVEMTKETKREEGAGRRGLAEGHVQRA